MLEDRRYIYKNTYQRNQYQKSSLELLFNNSIKVKKLEFKNILINEKNHKDLVIHFTRYVHNKSIKTLRMQFGELIGKIEEHGGKNV